MHFCTTKTTGPEYDNTSQMSAIVIFGGGSCPGWGQMPYIGHESVSVSTSCRHNNSSVAWQIDWQFRAYYNEPYTATTGAKCQHTERKRPREIRQCQENSRKLSPQLSRTFEMFCPRGKRDFSFFSSSYRTMRRRKYTATYIQNEIPWDWELFSGLTPLTVAVTSEHYFFVLFPLFSFWFCAADYLCQTLRSLVHLSDCIFFIYCVCLISVC